MKIRVKIEVIQMKLLMGWSKKIGLVSTALLGSLFIGNLSVEALTEQQILQKLGTVPVFTITNEQGALITLSIAQDENQRIPVAGAFISGQDAQAFIEQRIKKNNPELGNTAQVAVVTIADIYKLEQGQNNPEGVDFVVVPVQQQVESAINLLRQRGQQVEQFPDVPLFYATAGENPAYLTTQQNGQPIIPLFFDKDQLQQQVERYKQGNPEIASTVKIQVLSLGRLIEAWKTQDAPELNRFELLPSPETIEFLQRR